MFDSLLPELLALGQVVFIDLVLAGDNAIVVGMAAAGVAREQRAKVIFWGIAAAVVLRIVFALLTTQLLAIIGLTFAGGILLLWVCWKLFRELREQREEDIGAEMVASDGESAAGSATVHKTMGAAVWQVIVADVSMSLDNVLAVAGAAREHLWVLVVGLVLSVALMGAAATVIARLLSRYHWIAYIGLAVILYVALEMIWRGGFELLAATGQT
ncbi:TerC family protein [Azospirillum sp.]|uniref:TerC family protein n=1 Tax=Azospirillum sp. TaxID=34012 RepID=UPI002D42421F|nr:TerC family protein [Azospirillum sp.]HYD64206.1 TerC family protein [Azospirillum sp.]